MLCRYIALQFVIGAALALALMEVVSDVTQLGKRDKPRDIPETASDSDAYTGEVDIAGDIPDFYQSAEGTADGAGAFLRTMRDRARSRR